MGKWARYQLVQGAPNFLLLCGALIWKFSRWSCQASYRQGSSTFQSRYHKHELLLRGGGSFFNSPPTCGVNQMSSGTLGIMHMGHFLEGCLDNTLFLLQLPNFFLGSLGHQEGADIVIWGDSKCLYRQKSLKKCLFTYPRGVLP